jgi:hypothetical protein
LTKMVISNYNQKGGEGREQLTWRLRPRGSRAINTKDAKQGPPRPRSLTIATKRKQTWNVWTLIDLVQELCWQHHDYLSSKKKQRTQNFGGCSWRRRWQWPIVGGKIRVLLSLAHVTVD